MDKIVIIGYSGHAYVVCDIFESQDQLVVGYCDKLELEKNHFQLKYFGSEEESAVINKLINFEWFIAIGNNKIRQIVYNNLVDHGLHEPINAIHARSILSKKIVLKNGVMVGSGATINAFAQIGQGAICNTGCIIEHECKIGAFAHIAPGAVLAGNVTVGGRTFIGANSVIKQGIQIGENVTVGAGAVIINDIPDNAVVVGNPGKIIKYNT